jgi:hypothetical protein
MPVCFHPTSLPPTSDRYFGVVLVRCSSVVIGVRSGMVLDPTLAGFKHASRITFLCSGMVLDPTLAGFKHASRITFLCSGMVLDPTLAGFKHASRIFFLLPFYPLSTVNCGTILKALLEVEVMVEVFGVDWFLITLRYPGQSTFARRGGRNQTRRWMWGSSSPSCCGDIRALTRLGGWPNGYGATFLGIHLNSGEGWGGGGRERESQ